MIKQIHKATRNTDNIKQAVRSVLSQYDHVNTFKVTFEPKVFTVWVNDIRLSEFVRAGL